MRKSNYLVFVATTLLLLLVPTLAAAHGEEVIFLPLGTILAIPIATTIIWRSFDTHLPRLITTVVALSTAIPPWYLPGSMFGISGTKHFLAGFMPPMIIAILAWSIFRARLTNSKDPGDSGT